MAASGPARPPANIEDFLWNLHSVLVQVPGPLVLDQLKEAYAKQLGHKCTIERWLVVGDGGLAATLKRIPHVVQLFSASGATCVRATLPADCTKEQLIEKDKQYRAEIKKNAAAKGAKATAPAAGGASQAPPAAAPAKRPAPEAKTAAKAPAPKVAKNGGEAPAKPKAGGEGADPDTLARMLIQGVMRVLQNRNKEGKGPLPISDLETEFKALWKVPFNLTQAGETDAVTFLQKYPNKVEVIDSNGVTSVQISKLSAQKGKDKTVAPAAKPAAPEGAAAPGAKASAPGVVKAAAAPPPKAAAEAPAAAPAQPTRPPGTIEDFLWNLHSVLESTDSPILLDKLKEVYSSQLGHRCCIERFLVVGADGLAGTLKRIPHIVKLTLNNDNVQVVEKVLAKGTTKEALIAADQEYRAQISQRSKNAKAAQAQKASAPVVAASKPTAPGPAAPPVAAVAPVEAKAAPATRPSVGGGEPEAKKPRVEAAGQQATTPREDADTLQRMLVQGVIRVVQNRAKEGKGPQPIDTLADDFKALWKVPFNLQQAGETDTMTFLKKYPNKLEVTKVGNQDVVQLASKAGAKAPSAVKAGAVATPAEPAAKAAAPAAAEPAKPAAAQADVSADAEIAKVQAAKDAEMATVKATAMAALDALEEEQKALKLISARQAEILSEFSAKQKELSTRQAALTERINALRQTLL